MTTKVELQEQALQQEVPIFHPTVGDAEPKELTKTELEVAIAAKVEQLQAETVEAEKAREPIPAEPEPEPAADKPDDVRMAGPGGQARQPRKRRATVADPSAEMLKAYGLRKPTDKDRALAKKHSYPIAVPAGRAYTTVASFNCSLGGGVRPMNSVVILTDEQADHKSEFVTPV